MDPLSINKDFAYYASKYQSGELVFFVDGTGSFPFIFQATDNTPPSQAIVRGIYQIQEQIRTKTRLCFWDMFGTTEIDMNNPDHMKNLDSICSGGSFEDQLYKLISTYEQGARDPLHVLLISDGQLILDASDIIPKLKESLQKNAAFSIDFIEAAPHADGIIFDKIAKECSEGLPLERQTRNYKAQNGQDLEKAIIQAVNDRMRIEYGLLKPIQQGLPHGIKAETKIRIRERRKF